MGDLDPHILNYYLGSIYFSLEQTISTLQATTTLTHLAVGFESSYKSTPVNNRRFIEPLCRCIANLRRHNPNHPLDTLFIQFAKKDDYDAVDQLLVAAKEYGIHNLLIDSSHLPIQYLVKFCRGNTHFRDLTIFLTTLLLSKAESTTTVPLQQQPDEPQVSSAVLALVKLMMTGVTFENSKAATKFSNFIAHVTYPLLILINVTVGGGENAVEKKRARKRLVSALLEPSAVAQLTLDRECAIENMDVIESCATVTQIQRFSSNNPRFYVRPDAVQEKLQAIAMRNRELTRFRANPPEYPGDELLVLMRQFDNCPSGRYLLARSFHGMLSAQGLTTVLTEPRTLRTWITSATTAIRTWCSKLFTHEDPLHLHKCLGLLCLCSFAFRLSHIGDDTDMAFGSHPELTVATVLLHWLLVVSSFVFVLPQQRIKEGTRIWPESRIHTLCFVSRSLATILWAWYEGQVLVSPEPYYWVNTVIVLSNLVAVDYGSATVKYKSRAIRDAQGPAVLKLFASMMQFWATAHCLMGFRERVSIQFYAVFIMQLTAFLTTLRRKNLIRHSTVIVLYILQLVVAIGLGRTLVDPTKHPVLYEQFMTNRSATFLVGNTAALLRMMPITKTTTTPQATTATATTSLWRLWMQRKYVVWMLMSLWCIELRQTVYGTEDDLVARWWTRAQLEQATASSFLALLVFAYYQVT